jgi:hypothetical protein
LFSIELILSTNTLKILKHLQQHQGVVLTEKSHGPQKKSSGFEDAMGSVSMLPWWAGVALALVSYVFLHQLTQPPSVKALQAGQMGGFVAASLVSAFAMAGQF